MTLLTHIDHVQIGVSDIGSAAEAFGSFLGREPSWRGEHPRQGTANCLFRIDNTYLELIAGGSFLKRRIESDGEGITGLFFATHDVDGYVARVRRFVPNIEAREGRGVDASGATRVWRSAHIMTEQNRGNFHAAIQHDTDPNVLPMAAPMGPDYVTALAEVRVSSINLDATRVLYEDILELEGIGTGRFRIGSTELAYSADGEDYHRDRVHTLVFAANNTEASRMRTAAPVMLGGVKCDLK